MRHVFFAGFGLLAIAVALVARTWPPVLWSLVALVPLFVLGLRDIYQRRRAVLRNFPLIGHFRYLLEMIRPEINQYFVESNIDGTPFNREVRSVIYQRAKGALDTLPFGTQRDVAEPGYEWINHSIGAKTAAPDHRILIGERQCAQPYSASLLNIAAMSYGAMSKNAILALSRGAKMGGFFHNTGEGACSSYHLEGGGDLVWQIGTGYFGCRTPAGEFDPDRFAATAKHPSVKMIEVKISQGAKPGHGGILPAAKITPEIAAIRGVEMGSDVISPPGHSAFSTPVELMAFLERLRELSGGKPVGFKLCVGDASEFLGLCKAMVALDSHPDFITVDGGEGGTGAAPLEFSNSVGSPLDRGLSFVHNALIGFDLRDRIKIIASGKVTTGFHMAARLAMGADLCASARAMMFALGCIQARRCNSNHCPVGVATQNPRLVKGLDVGDKAVRVHRYQKETVHAFRELLGAAGLDHPDDLRPWHINRRVSPTRVLNYAQIYDTIEPGALLSEPVPAQYEAAWLVATPEAF